MRLTSIAVAVVVSAINVGIALAAFVCNRIMTMKIDQIDKDKK